MAGSADLSLQLRKKSLARGYLSAVQIGAPINVARSINPLSKGNIYSGNCVLRHGYTQPLVHPPWERPPFTLRFKTFCTFFLRTTDRCLSTRRNLLSSRISPTFFSFFLFFLLFPRVVCKLLADVIEDVERFNGTIIDKICSRVRDMKYLILVNARLYRWKKNKNGKSY